MLPLRPLLVLELPHAATSSSAAMEVSSCLEMRRCEIRPEIRDLAVGNTVQPPQGPEKRALPSAWRKSGPSSTSVSMGQWSYHFGCDNAGAVSLDTSPLRPLGRTRLYEDLVDRLGGFVIRTNLEVGGRFPPERELASRLEVSRASLRQALAVLEAQVFIEV